MPTIANHKEQQNMAYNRKITEEQVRDLRPVELSASGYRGLKRGLDVLFSALGLLALAFPMAVLALVIYIDDPGPVIFHQDRVGREGKVFRFYKFRTMHLDTPKYKATGELEHPEKHLTRVGRVLRKLSLDEIPQLFNVLKGDMSLVGPRPLIPQEVEIHEMRLRFGAYGVRPGVTGLAQINGRDLLSAAQKVRYDVQYLERFSFRGDLEILLSTIPKVLGGEDVAEGKNGGKETKNG